MSSESKTEENSLEELRDEIIANVYPMAYPEEGKELPVILETDTEEQRDAKQKLLDSRTIYLVDLPAGTILFRGERVPDATENELNFYRDFLGTIGVEGKYCMAPNYNVFFYPFPFVPFGVRGYGKRFNAIQMYVTRKKVTVVCMISPSTQVRGNPKGYDMAMPIIRCNNLVEQLGREDVLCGVTGEKRKDKLRQMTYDNCLNPNLLGKGVPLNGWMAIAENDSIDIFERDKKTGRKKYEMLPKFSPLGTYLKQFTRRAQTYTRSISQLPEVLSWMYKDANPKPHPHRGYPEIALHPWSPHPGNEMIYTDVKTVEEALDFIEKNSSRFTYLPLACFTKSQTLDGIGTDYKVSNIDPQTNRSKWSRMSKEDAKKVPKEQREAAEKEAAEASKQRHETREGIEKQIHQYMRVAMEEGLDIPGIGLSKIVFDTRTGFYVLDSFIRKRKPVLIDEETKEHIMDYTKVLMKLETEQERENAMDYNIIYNKYNPQKFLRPSLLYQDGPSVYRAFIFERPEDHMQVYTNLDEKRPLRLENVTRRRNFVRERNKINAASFGFQKGMTATIKRGGFRKTRRRRTRNESMVNELLGSVQEALVIEAAL